VNRVLEHGAILLLRFSAGHEVYVEELRSGRFGWVPENAGSWEKLQLETPPATDQVSLDRPLIQETLDEANRLFVSLYDHFNRQSAQHLTPPRWELTLVPEGYSCTLTRAPESADYVETTDQMARALQVTLLGRGWTVRTIPLTILIYHPERDATAR